MTQQVLSLECSDDTEGFGRARPPFCVRVKPRAAVEQVVAAIGISQVGVQRVLAGAALQKVAPAAAVKNIRAPAAHDPVIAAQRGDFLAL